jgi:hypothetical protein
MILLQLEVPLLLHQVNWVKMLVPLLDTLDKFNRLASGVDKEDIEDLSWPGIIGSPYISCSIMFSLLYRSMNKKAYLSSHNPSFLIPSQPPSPPCQYLAQLSCSVLSHRSLSLNSTAILGIPILSISF